jgi:solute carrier family 39 (zinc transporter), member 1/2/3
MAGLVAMVAALVVVALDQYLSARGAGHSHAHAHELWEQESDNGEVPRPSSPGHGTLAVRRGGHRPSDISMGEMEASEGLMAGVSPLPESTPTIPTQTRLTQDDDDEAQSDAESDLELNIEELDPEGGNASQSRPLARRHANPLNGHAKKDSVASVPHIPTPEEQQRLMLQCLMLEAGILFHSVFIGMAISVATGSTFIVFLIAISFHQTFEGLALGSRIAAIHFPRTSLRPWLMVLAFGLTTPLGQAIGLVVHNMYDPMSQAGLLVVGFMNAISAGLLLFAGLVQLLAEDFLTEKSYTVLKGRRRVMAYISVVCGAGLMAAVGAFA